MSGGLSKNTDAKIAAEFRAKATHVLADDAEVEIDTTRYTVDFGNSIARYSCFAAIARSE